MFVVDVDGGSAATTDNGDDGKATIVLNNFVSVELERAKRVVGVMELVLFIGVAGKLQLFCFRIVFRVVLLLLPVEVDAPEEDETEANEVEAADDDSCVDVVVIGVTVLNCN